jgi:ketosteroid isomerase-like protein
MRALIISALPLVLATTPLAGQQPKQRSTSATTQVLTRLENDWAHALVRRDTATFRRLLAPRFVYTEDAQVMGAEDVIHSVVGPDQVEWAGNEDMQVREHGNTAVVTGILAVKGKGKSGAFSRRYRFTDTWLRMGSRWRVIAAQDYLMPK